MLYENKNDSQSMRNNEERKKVKRTYNYIDWFRPWVCIFVFYSLIFNLYKYINHMEYFELESHIYNLSAIWQIFLFFTLFKNHAIPIATLKSNNQLKYFTDKYQMLNW